MTEERPLKRHRTSQDDEDAKTLTRRIILDEIDLEIGIRRRLQETISTRIAWAVSLRESLVSGITSEAFLRDESFNYQTVALETLRAAEAPVLPLLSHEARSASSVPSASLPYQNSLALSEGRVPSTATAATPSQRTSIRATRAGGQPPVPRATRKKLLYLRNTSEHPPTLAKLVCPDCGRLDLPNVQGLLNHCRLRHHREFGTHDECVRACAALVPAEDEAWVVENGIELPEISLPSLRTLFERAVGASSGSEIAVPVKAGLPDENDSAVEVDHRTISQNSSTHLSRTLGHHVDTPSLAPFLGRTAQRRAIAVHAEDSTIDIVEISEGRSDNRWKKLSSHRSIARPTIDFVDQEMPGVLPNPQNSHIEPIQSHPKGPLRMPLNASSSRFHITARVSISDRSLWLPSERRDLELQDHTHRWMISAESPSYSFHISTFLTKMTVRSITNPPPSTLRKPLVASAYPFAVLSTTDRPFLAEITLSFTGESNTDMIVHHWVELDIAKSSSPVLGDEQVLDIELDRTTELLPTVTPVPLASLWAVAPRIEGYETKSPNAEEEQPMLPYIQLLRALVPKFPLVAAARDAKSRTTLLPYKLVSGPQALRALIPGRRKAIEWGRARALQDAYKDARDQFAPDEQRRYLPLSTADVFCWLEDEGLFLRPPPAQPLPPTKKNSTDTKAVQLFCPSCGISLALHPRTETRAEEEDPAIRKCATVLRPVRELFVDPSEVLASEDSPSISKHLSQDTFSRKDFLTVVDPRIISAITKIFTSLQCDIAQNNATIPHAGSSNAERLGLSAAAALSLATRALVNRVLLASIDVMRDDVRRGASAQRRPATLLAPTHVFRALEAHPLLRILGSTLMAPAFP